MKLCRLRMVWRVGVLSVLVACASYVPEQRPHLAEHSVLWLQLERLDADGTTLQTSVLSVQGLANRESRWLQTDAFGVPQARLIAGADGWRNDGFAPPNREAQRLFESLFPLLPHGVEQTVVRVGEQQWRVSLIQE